MEAYVIIEGAKESRSFDPLRETKIGTTLVVREIGSNITVFDWGERNEFEKNRESTLHSL